VATITALERHHEEFRESEVERARRSLAGGTPEGRVLEEFARRLTNKFLHAPTQALRDADTTERATLVAFLSHIYNLP
jgi:glutamyl-tRNA reductase